MSWVSVGASYTHGMVPPHKVLSSHLKLSVAVGRLIIESQWRLQLESSVP